MLVATKQKRSCRKDGRSMWHVWETGEARTGFLWGDQKGNKQLERPLRRCKIILKWKLQDVGLVG